jgi:SPP1 family phage portal protein
LELEQAKKFIKKHMEGHQQFVTEASIGNLYYLNQNDIKRKDSLDDLRRRVDQLENPLRNADYRISHNWHQLLVNQKVAYLFTYPPMFDAGIDDLNTRINEVLGEAFAKEVKDLAIEASNTGVAWLHCWVDDSGQFQFADVPSEQIIPVYSNALLQNLDAVLRVYHILDDNAKDITRYEIWTDKEVSFYEQAGNRDIGFYYLPDINTNILTHDMGYVPFVPFYNNSTHTGDLTMYKDLVDQYDKVVSGFANDLTDIQEVIFVLRNYGGEDLATFLTELKRYKAIKVDGDTQAAGGVETMQIEIPIEARVKFLEILKKQIFISGQGVDPDPQNFGNSSGVALKYLYSLLEIKAGLLETEFRAGFKQFLKLILHYLRASEDIDIQQIYTRNMISNDQETAQIARDSKGIISDRTILANHPWVEDVEAEQKQIEEEEAAVQDKMDAWGIGPNEGGDNADGSEEE